MTTESTRQILSTKSEYIGWKRMTMLDLLEAGYIATSKSTQIITGQSEEKAVHRILKTVSLKLQNSIPMDCSDTVARLISHLDSKFASESKFELHSRYISIKMVGIRPTEFITNLDIARTAIIHANGSISPNEQLGVIFSNCHQAFYSTWIRDQRIMYKDSIITQDIIQEVTKSMKEFFEYSPDDLKNGYEGRKFSANSATVNRPICSHCHKAGHLEETCYILHPALKPPYRRRYQEGTNERKKPASTSQIKEVEAYFDSCANKHFFKDQPANTIPVNATVLTADGSPCQIQSKGRIKLGDIWIDNVFHTPAFTKNLVSGIELLKNGYEIKMKNMGMTVAKDGEIKATASYDPQTDLLKMNNVILSANATSSNIPPINRYSLLENPEPILANQRAKDIQRNKKTILYPLEIVELDIQGPFKLKAEDGTKMNLKMVDKNTGYVKVDFLKSKSAASITESFQRFHVRSERQSGAILKRVRTDGDGAFYKDFLAYTESMGIIKELTPPYVHHLPAQVERMHQTLTHQALICLTDSKLPPSFYHHAIDYSAFVYNHTFIREDGKTPFELLFKKPSKKDMIVPFGLTGWAFLPLETRNMGKLQARRSKVRMLGFGQDFESEETHGYKVRAESDGHIFFTSDVKWDSNHPMRPLENQNYESPDETIFEVEDNVTDSDEYSPSTIHDDGTTLTPSPRTPQTYQSTQAPSTETSQSLYQPSNDENINYEIEALSADIQEISDRYKDTIFQGLAATYQDLYKGNEPKDIHQLMSIFYAFHASSSDISIPKTYDEAITHPHCKLWKAAMDKELASISNNKTWTLTALPKGKKQIKNKWVFTLKYDSSGNITKYKARLVAKGFTQKAGIDYTETFSPVSKIASWRILIAIAASKGWKIFQDDVPSAFLKGHLQEEIYMEQPPGYHIGEKSIVCKLDKTLYGLKQSAREFNKVATSFLTSQGFTQLGSEPCLFSREVNQKFIYCVIWVDDILTTGNDDLGIFRRELQKFFNMEPGSELTWCLGLHVQCDPLTRDIYLDQDRYIQDKFNEFDKYIGPGGSKTPLPSNYKELIKEAGNTTLPSFPYAPMLGSLMYAMLSTRPDICTAISFLSRFMKNPKRIHCQLLQHVYRYVKANPYRICYKFDAPLILTGWVDAAFANNEDCKSTGGYVFSLGSGPISWSSNKQPVTSLSSSEAEYMAVTPAGQECIWLRNVLNELNIPQNSVILYEDNQAAIQLSTQPKVNKRTKHIDIRYHWIREKIEEGLFKLSYCPTKSQIADIMTKIPSSPLFHHLVSLMGMRLPNSTVFPVKEGVRL